MCNILAALLALALPWEDPAVNSINRLPARNFVPPAAEWTKSLFCIWKYRWCGALE